jgi:hypothetical protein
MKYLAVLLLISSTAYAGIMGVLVRSSSGSSITGHLVWECTYQVLGSEQTVTLSHMCPQTMMFNWTLVRCVLQAYK